jgi:hypothetical protein
MFPDQWQYIDSILTPHYCRKVELQAERAEILKSQLVARTANQVTFKVWVHRDDDADDGDVEDDVDESYDEVPCSDEDTIHDSSDSNSESSDESSNKGNGEHGPVPHRESGQDMSDDDFSSCASDGIDDYKPFLWRRVRAVVCDLVEGENDMDWRIQCDCGYMSRTCIRCRHIMHITKKVVMDWGFKEQPWHMRLLKEFSQR